MNQLLVEFQVKKLLSFFESYPRKEKSLIPREFKNLMKGLMALIENSPDNFSYNESGENLNFKTIKDKQDLKKELQKILREPDERTIVGYSEICNILKVYWALITLPEQKELTATDWLQITGYLRDLELERLSVRTKK